MVGDAVGQITDLFGDRSNLCFEQLQARANHGEPVMSDHAFERYVRQSVVVDFDQFIFKRDLDCLALIDYSD